MNLERSRSKLKNLFLKYIQSILNQKVTFILSFAFFVVSCVLIFKTENSEFLMDLLQGIGLAVIFSFSASIFTEKLDMLKKYIIQSGTAIASGVLGFFAASGFDNEYYEYLYYYGISCVAILFTVFVFIPKNDSKTYFACLFKNFLFCLLMALLLSLGLILLTAAVDNLIYKVKHVNDFYACCFSFGFSLFFVNAFAYFLMFRRNDESSGKAFKVIFLYILFPIFCVLILILYLYLLKALVIRKLPQGQINWFVSFASCIFVVFYFILREYESLPAVRIFYKFGHFILIPLICVQIPAYFIRLNAYGFTGYRFSSLLFIIFSIIMIVTIFIKKGKFTNYLLLVLASFVLFASVSPWNLIDVPYKNQFKRMEDVLYRYDMYDGSKLLDYDIKKVNAVMTADDREKLNGAFSYLWYKNNSKTPQWFSEGTKDLYTFEQFFGFPSSLKEVEKNIIIYNYYPVSKPIDISQYSTIEKLSLRKYCADKNETFECNSVVIGGYNITDYLLGLKKDDSSEKKFITNDGSMIYFTEIEYRYIKEEKRFQDYSVDCYLLKK